MGKLWAGADNLLQSAQISKVFARDDITGTAPGAASFTSAIGVWEWDVVNNRVSWNEDNYRLHGLAVREVAPGWGGWLDCIIEADREHAAVVASQSLRTGQPFSIHYRVQSPTGRVRHLIGRGIVIADDLGNPERMIGTNVDVTAVWDGLNVLRGDAERLVELLGGDEQDADVPGRLAAKILSGLAATLKTFFALPLCLGL